MQSSPVKIPLRDLDGVLLLNKPEGGSSNDVLQKVRRIYRAKKGGHTGSLDPFATGMLPVCFGEATKFATFLLEHDKSYQVVASLGTQTDTADKTGKVVNTMPVPELTVDAIEEVLNSFRGLILQVPPMYSALKVNGQRLYVLARQGIEVERHARPITVHKLIFESYEKVDDTFLLTLTVECSKGTYIRTLVEDIAHALGTCAHVLSLHRTVVGHFNPNGMISIESLLEAQALGVESLDAYLLPFEHILPPDWPRVLLSESQREAFLKGQTIVWEEPISSETWIQVMDEAGRFIGIGHMKIPFRLSPKRLVRTVS